MAKALEIGLTALERINISSRNVHRVLRVDVPIRWVPAVHPRRAVVACILLGIAGLVAGVQLWRDAETWCRASGATRSWRAHREGLFFLTVAAHQIVHGLALVHYRRRVREFGFTFLHGFVPTFYVDVTDIFMASRKARVVTAVAGTLVHLVLGSLWFLLAANAPLGSFTQAFAATSGMIQWQALVVALYPFCFIEMDGYHVLVDVLGVPTLKQEASSWVGRLITGARPGASAGRSSCGRPTSYCPPSRSPRSSRSTSGSSFTPSS